MSFVLSIGTAFLTYIESEYLEGLIGAEYLGLGFFVAYGLTLVALDQLPRLVDRWGKWAVAVGLTLTIIGSLAALSAVPASPWIALPLFTAYLVALSVVWIVLDFFIEMYSTDAVTGTVRGRYLTIMNAGWVITPIISFALYQRFGFSFMFGIASLLTVPVFLVFWYGFRETPDHIRHPRKFWATLFKIFQHRELSHIFIISFVLQFFYAWMVFYTPLHLRDLGFAKEEIGKILSLMLLPFVLFQYPAGLLADRKLGEKELTILGLFLMGTATLVISYVRSTELLVWAGLLFSTRIGAALIEVMRDTYFFKHIDYRDLQLISFYRNTGPLAYMTAPLLATGILFFTGKETLFFILGIIVLGTIVVAARLKDTK